jgi:hypothetical protein
MNISVVVYGCETWFVTLEEEQGVEKYVCAKEREKK